MSEKYKPGLDYKLYFSELEREWQVWTPAYDGALGAIIGTGKTIREAKTDAVKNMKHLCAEFSVNPENPVHPVANSQ